MGLPRPPAGACPARKSSRARKPAGPPGVPRPRVGKLGWGPRAEQQVMPDQTRPARRRKREVRLHREVSLFFRQERAEKTREPGAAGGPRSGDGPFLPFRAARANSLRSGALAGAARAGTPGRGGTQVLAGGVESRCRPAARARGGRAFRRLSFFCGGEGYSANLGGGATRKVPNWRSLSRPCAGREEKAGCWPTPGAGVVAASAAQLTPGSLRLVAPEAPGKRVAHRPLLRHCVGPGAGGRGVCSGQPRPAEGCPA